MQDHVEASFGLLFFKKVADGLYMIGAAAEQEFSLAVGPAPNLAPLVLLPSTPSLARIMLRRHALVSSILALGADFLCNGGWSRPENGSAKPTEQNTVGHRQVCLKSNPPNRFAER